MGKDGRRSETVGGKRERLRQVAQKHVAVVGDAVGMGGDPAVEAVDVPFRKETAQVVVGAAVAKPDFKDVTGPVLDEDGGLVKAQALGLEAADGAVEPAHASGAGPGGHGVAQHRRCFLHPAGEFAHDLDRD